MDWCAQMRRVRRKYHRMRRDSATGDRRPATGDERYRLGANHASFRDVALQARY